MLMLWQVMTAVAASSGGAIGERKRPPGAQRTTTWVESSEASSAALRVSPPATAVVFSTSTVTRSKPPTGTASRIARPSIAPARNGTGAPGAGSSTRWASPSWRKCAVAATSEPATAMHCSRTRSCVCGLPAAYAGG